MTVVRVALVSTAPSGERGSMRAYADSLLAGLADHAPEIEPTLVELDPGQAGGPWGGRFRTLLMPLRAWRQRSRQPDLWHILDGSRAYVAAALGPAPVIVTVHDVIPCLQARGEFAGAPAIGTAARALWRGNARAMEGAAALVCVSSNTARDIQRLWNFSSEKTVVVPLPVRPSMAELASESNSALREDGVVLHVGNNGFYKNRAGVLRIFAKLHPAVARKLVMAGPRPGEELLRLAEQLGIGPRVEWSCDPDDADLAAIYRRSSALLFPSLYEGFGWPVLEAMAFGLPVVASNTGSLPQVVGSAARCTDPHDEALFASMIEQLLRSPLAASEASAKGLAQSKAFNSAAFAGGMKAAYTAAIRRTRGSGKL